jgi:hypothetical protein
LGVTLNGFFFYLLGNWQLVLIFYLILPLLVGLFGLLLFIEETPFDVIVNYPPEHSFNILKMIASKNKCEEDHLTL